MGKNSTFAYVLRLDSTSKYVISLINSTNWTAQTYDMGGLMVADMLVYQGRFFKFGGTIYSHFVGNF
jgi:hypothetical protein